MKKIKLKYRNQLTKKFSVNLRTLRLKTKLTQRELGYLTRIPHTRISEFELANALPSFGSLVSLASALNVPIQKLIYGYKGKL